MAAVVRSEYTAAGTLRFYNEETGADVMVIGPDGVDLSVGASDLANGSVTAAKLAADAVETAKIKNANVTAAKLAADAVETAAIKDLNVTTGKLADGAVTVAKTDGTLIELGGGLTDQKVVYGNHFTDSATGVRVHDLTDDFASVIAFIPHPDDDEGVALAVQLDTPDPGKVTVTGTLRADGNPALNKGYRFLAVGAKAVAP